MDKVNTFPYTVQIPCCFNLSLIQQSRVDLPVVLLWCSKSDFLFSSFLVQLLEFCKEELSLLSHLFSSVSMNTRVFILSFRLLKSILYYNQYYQYLFCCSDCSTGSYFGWILVPFWHAPILVFWGDTYFLFGTTRLIFYYPLLALKSATSPRSPVPFIREWYTKPRSGCWLCSLIIASRLPQQTVLGNVFMLYIVI